MKAKRLLVIAASVITTGALGAAVGGATQARTSPSPAARAAAAALASVRVQPGVIPLNAGAMQRPPTTAQCRRMFKIPCYSPRQIEQAYGLPTLYSRGTDGRGQTIVIVDSFGSPTIGHDLATFDKTYGLPNPPSLKIIQPAGPVPPYKPVGVREGWAFETTLDVEYSHTVAPEARIILVETPTAETEGTGGFPQIVTAEEYVISHHLGGVISQSFGATEQSFPNAQSLLALRTPYKEAAAAGITVLASTGDYGAANLRRNGSSFFDHPAVAWPATDPLVTAVGGTQLHLDAAGDRTSPDTVWNDTYNPAVVSQVPSPAAGAGGKSVIFGRPSYQNGVESVTGNHRGIPDISMSAACNGSVILYLSFGGLTPGYYTVCGTSEASPEFAGIVALADQVAGHPLGPINPALYAMSAAHDPGIVDVTSGNNSVAFIQNGRRVNITGYQAGPGYDLASGVGTVYAPDFVPELAHAAG